ncbi:tripartite motif-containing protein 35-like [Megalops cyprinoides]|uniref:tripartite motif-containing protein 35-like n=1 Tax=Megalops cyprinoides TaxID=118141 RepID=UPI0018653635|nr:tripartite motif-containing protein 35-like [Megalops cyprinoides]
MEVASPHLEEELTCPVCSATCGDPVTLKCSHSFCRPCVSLEEPHECPICRGTEPGEMQHPNLAPGCLRETPLQERGPKAAAPTITATAAPRGPGSREPCRLHGQELELFCLQDQVPVCDECVSGPHKDHMACLVRKAVRHRKEALRTMQKTLRVKLGAFRAAKDSCDQRAQLIRSQLLETERRMREEYERLHEFLRKDMAASLDALRLEEDQMTNKLTMRTEKLEKEIVSLSDKLQSIKQAMDDQDIPFLQNYKDTKSRAQCTVQDPGRLSGVQIDVAKHLGNLRLRVLKNMLAPVVLNPNTAHPSLSVSADLTSAMCDKKEHLPNDPGRVTSMPWVLGSVGYSSGRRTWDVDVAGVPAWGVGVVGESVCKGGAATPGPELAACYVMYRDGEYTSNPPVSLAVSGTLPTIRVQLDFDSGSLSFCDPHEDRPLVVFPLREKVFPFFSVHPTSDVPLRISGIRLSIYHL